MSSENSPGPIPKPVVTTNRAEPPRTLALNHISWSAGAHTFNRGQSNCSDLRWGPRAGERISLPSTEQVQNLLPRISIRLAFCHQTQWTRSTMEECVPSGLHWSSGGGQPQNLGNCVTRWRPSVNREGATSARGSPVWFCRSVSWRCGHPLL